MQTPAQTPQRTGAKVLNEREIGLEMRLDHLLAIEVKDNLGRAAAAERRGGRGGEGGGHD